MHECQDWNTYVSISPHDRLMISTVKDFGSWAAEKAVASLWFRQAGVKKKYRTTIGSFPFDVHWSW